MANDLVIPKLEHHYEQTEDSRPPRAVLMQFTSKKVKDRTCNAGDIVHSVTDEKLSDKCIPLIHYITYLRFNAENSKSKGWNDNYKPNELIYSIRNPLEVPEGDLDWMHNPSTGKRDIPPVCSKTHNFLCYVRGQKLPIIFSFNKSSSREGLRFVDLYKSFDLLTVLFSVSSELSKDEKCYKYKISRLDSKELTQEDVDSAGAMYMAFKNKLDEVSQETPTTEDDKANLPF
jgi:hypothetical protein